MTRRRFAASAASLASSSALPFCTRLHHERRSELGLGLDAGQELRLADGAADMGDDPETAGALVAHVARAVVVGAGQEAGPHWLHAMSCPRRNELGWPAGAPRRRTVRHLVGRVRLDDAQRTTPSPTSAGPLTRLGTFRGG